MFLMSLRLGRRRLLCRGTILLMGSSAGTARTLRSVSTLAAVHAAIAVGIAAAIGVLPMIGLASLGGLTMGGGVLRMVSMLRRGAIAGLLRRDIGRSRHLVALMRRGGLRPCRDGKGEGCSSSND